MPVAAAVKLVVSGYLSVHKYKIKAINKPLHKQKKSTYEAKGKDQVAAKKLQNQIPHNQPNQNIAFRASFAACLFTMMLLPRSTSYLGNKWQRGARKLGGPTSMYGWEIGLE